MPTPPPTIVFRAAALCDATGQQARPGTVVVRRGRILAAGPSDQVEAHRYERTTLCTLEDRLILPGMVNAHCHLDLNDFGTIPYKESFVAWIRSIQTQRCTDAAKIDRIVTQAAHAAHAAGVVAVGDIAAATTAASARDALERSPLIGVSFEEQIGSTVETSSPTASTTSPADRHGIRHGLQPHAPYSTAPAIYRHAASMRSDHGIPVATHLAELPEEVEFVRDASGPFRALLESLGRWNEAYASHYGHGQHPVDWMAPHLRRGAWLLAHVNLLDDVHIPLLAACGASVAYCPVASDYFGHRRHRYRELLAAGVNVCLGTDSILCQDAVEAQPLGILPQMRYLYQRDGTAPSTLLAMATTRGAHALGLPAGTATLLPGARADLYTIRINPDDPTDAMTQALNATTPVKPIEDPGD